jgi:hypothetical protein
MMRAVGHPGGGNPDAALQKVARAEGWRIMRIDRHGPMLKIGSRARRGAPGRRRRLRAGRLRTDRRAQPWRAIRLSL